MTTMVATNAETDVEIILRAREGDNDAFRQLVERYQERAYWIAQGKVHNAEDAMEIAQEAFVRVHRSLHRFNPNLKFYTWFYQIVTNLSIDTLRRRKKRARVSIDDIAEAEAQPSQPGAGLEARELQARVYVILDCLPEKYAAVIRMKDIEGLGAKDISELTGVSHATVRWRLHQARKLFRSAWNEKYGEYQE
jgi:RNA polymerase sigma-70 factor, ECF subfamily